MAELLTRSQFEPMLRTGELAVEPMLDLGKQVSDLGIDLRLDCFFREFVRSQGSHVDLATDRDSTELKRIQFGEAYFLHPGEFVLGQSLEYVVLPRTVFSVLNGRSSLGRRGLVIHATANMVDPGWKGHIVFELANLGVMPIQLYPLMRLARLTFFRVPETAGYEGSFQNQLRISTPPQDEVAALIARKRAP